MLLIPRQEEVIIDQESMQILPTPGSAHSFIFSGDSLTIRANLFRSVPVERHTPHVPVSASAH